MDANPATRSVIGLVAANPELAKKAVWLRGFGQAIIETMGSKKVHPNHAIPGGVNTALSPKARNEFLSQIDKAIAIYQLGLDIIKDFQTKQKKLVRSFASFPSAYLSLVDTQGNVEFYDGNLRLRDAKGLLLEDQVPDNHYLSIIEEKVEDWSYMKFPYYKKMGYPAGIYRVGPLARLNVADGFTTPLASKEFQGFKKLGNGGMVEGSMYFHYARLIEGLYATEKLKELLQKDEICSVLAKWLLALEAIRVAKADAGNLQFNYREACLTEFNIQVEKIR